jgi:hypothetical protein
VPVFYVLHCVAVAMSVRSQNFGKLFDNVALHAMLHYVSDDFVAHYVAVRRLRLGPGAYVRLLRGLMLGVAEPFPTLVLLAPILIAHVPWFLVIHFHLVRVLFLEVLAYVLIVAHFVDLPFPHKLVIADGYFVNHVIVNIA